MKNNSVKDVISNNMYMIKLLVKASKWRLLLESLFYTSKGVIQTLIYVILFGSIINALQDGSSFMYIAIFIGVIAIITCIALFFQSWFTDVFLMYDNAAIQKYFTRNVYQHAVELDIEKYDDPKFYDQYILTLEEAQNRAIILAQTVAQYIGTLITVILLLTTIVAIDINVLWFVALPLIPSLIIGKKKNKCYYDLYMNNLNPSRKTAYVNRVMYLSKYAKDIRLTNIFNRVINTYHRNMDKVIDRKIGRIAMFYEPKMMPNRKIGRIGLFYEPKTVPNRKIGRIGLFYEPKMMSNRKIGRIAMFYEPKMMPNRKIGRIGMFYEPKMMPNRKIGRIALFYEPKVVPNRKIGPIAMFYEPKMMSNRKIGRIAMFYEPKLVPNRKIGRIAMFYEPKMAPNRKIGRIAMFYEPKMVPNRKIGRIGLFYEPKVMSNRKIGRIAMFYEPKTVPNRKIGRIALFYEPKLVPNRKIGRIGLFYEPKTVTNREMGPIVLFYKPKMVINWKTCNTKPVYKLEITWKWESRLPRRK
ncbi:hypothetical protein MUB24_05625 [Lederbergia sp. NSJ-179]|uniref:hypothetical protein n=1 Tax=Lederbergia sp. NSJ-179 TaxID=2931402 RepID=UPI001FD54CD5|nr:hypothetical protein [Lederbergia sp. NSJ-179]MCJ7840405.1 hypothetical protein [Lederbergia sp. NSJ-179]